MNDYGLRVRRARPGCWLALIHNRWGLTVWQAAYDTQPAALADGRMALRTLTALPPRAAA